jgi:hypothetical protein
MNTEDMISPHKRKKRALAEKLTPDAFEFRSKFGMMDLSHSLEMAKSRAL